MDVIDKMVKLGMTEEKANEVIRKAAKSIADKIDADLAEKIKQGLTNKTLIACEKLGRLARLMELDPKYVDVIIKRWQEFTGKKAIHADTGLEFPA